MDGAHGVIDLHHLPAMIVIGFAIFFGTIGARLFQKLRIPQVVGYIIIGLLAGESGFNVISQATVTDLQPFSFFALGIIGFLIGGELHRDVFKQHGKKFASILFSEAIGAFVIVSLLVTGVALLVTGRPTISVALGLVLGAISSATAPAATVNVLWEYKTRGPLTTAVFAIVAMDDALALGLYSIAASLATRLMGSDSVGWLASLRHVVWELGGGFGLGAITGVAMNLILRRNRDSENTLGIVIGGLALVVGVARLLGCDMILASMTLGAVIANLAPRRSNQAFTIVEKFTGPIFALFFVMVGAQLNLGGMPGWMWALAVPYVLGRSLGKVLGAGIGAKLGGAEPVVRKYLGVCLFSQAGVAVGLSITASQRFEGELGTAIITIIALTTFVVQMVGPSCVRYAVHKAGEVGLNVTEEDLISSYKVSDMVDRDAPQFSPGEGLDNILRTISRTHATAYPVTDRSGALSGVITLEGLKESFGAEGLTQWLVAYDLIEPAPEVVREDMPLEEAMRRMQEQMVEYLPVLDYEGKRLVGMLEMRQIKRRLSREILRRRQKAGDAVA